MPMRLFLALALLVLAGCDTLDTTGSGGAALMSRLDGTWTRTITMERIRSDGSVTPEGTPRVDAYVEFSRECGLPRPSVNEAAALVAWLASEECSFTTGGVFDLSGGRATY